MADRYISWTPGGDNIVGQLASGKNPESLEFATLPPHFKAEDTILNSEEWRLVFPGYEGFPSSFKRLLPTLLATVVYHSDWCRINIPPHFNLFTSYFWTNNYQLKLRSKVHTGVYYNDDSRLAASGMPTHICILRNMKAEYTELKTECQSGFTELKREVQVGFTELKLGVTALESKMEEYLLSKSTAVLSSTSDNSQLSSPTPLPLPLLLEKIVTGAVQNALVEYSGGGSSTSTTILMSSSSSKLGTAVVASSISGGPQPVMYSWGNMLHAVPEGFEINT
jgi:hypothetical protein